MDAITMQKLRRRKRTIERRKPSREIEFEQNNFRATNEVLQEALTANGIAWVQPKKTAYDSYKKGWCDCVIGVKPLLFDNRKWALLNLEKNKKFQDRVKKLMEEVV